MKKAAILALMILALVSVGCGGQSSQEEEEERIRVEMIEFDQKVSGAISSPSKDSGVLVDVYCDTVLSTWAELDDRFRNEGIDTDVAEDVFKEMVNGGDLKTVQVCR